MMVETISPIVPSQTCPVSCLVEAGRPRRPRFGIFTVTTETLPISAVATLVPRGAGTDRLLKTRTSPRSGAASGIAE